MKFTEPVKEHGWPVFDSGRKGFKWVKISNEELCWPIRTDAEIAKIMTERGHKMTREAVRQTGKRAIQKLRRLLKGWK